MSFITTIPVAQASGGVAEMYRRQQDAFGFVPNYAKVFCHRPAVMRAWAQLLVTLRQPMDLKTYELATLAAARAIGSSYCSLAHSRTLLAKFYSPDELEAIILKTPSSPLSAAERAVMRLAAKVAVDASALSQQDIDELRQYGYTDNAIFDVVAAAAARCFFAKIPDALGAEPDAPLGDLDANLLQLLLVGRPLSTELVEQL